MTDRELFEYARSRRIPGGVQLRSKLPELHGPGVWPAYSRRAEGIRVWDLDGRMFRDWATHGIGATLLGYRDPDVTAAVQQCVGEGSFSSLNAPEEVELADRLCELHPWAESVRFARTGGEAATVAVRVARATTDRSHVAVCGYHGWHDWYLAANLGEDDALRGHLLPGLDPLGVPSELRGTTLAFAMNDREAFDRTIAEAGDRLAAVVMEPCRFRDPDAGFLEHVREATRRVGALLVFDEITIGFRRTYGGAHLRLGVTPDIAFFAKSLGNGHPMAAILGTTEAMQGVEKTFVSSTYWTERVGPVAALATLRKMEQTKLAEQVDVTGRRLAAIWQQQADQCGLPLKLVDQYPCFAGFAFEHPQATELGREFVKQMASRDILARQTVYLTAAHDEQELEYYEACLGEVFPKLAAMLEQGELRAESAPATRDFRRLL